MDNNNILNINEDFDCSIYESKSFYKHYRELEKKYERLIYSIHKLLNKKIYEYNIHG